MSNLSFAYRHLVPAKIFAFNDLANNENSFARAFGGAGGTCECRGGCPPDPPSVGDVTGHSPFLCFLTESFLAN